MIQLRIRQQLLHHSSGVRRWGGLTAQGPGRAPTPSRWRAAVCFRGPSVYRDRLEDKVRWLARARFFGSWHCEPADQSFHSAVLQYLLRKRSAKVACKVVQSRLNCENWRIHGSRTENSPTSIRCAVGCVRFQ